MTPRSLQDWADLLPPKLHRETHLSKVCTSLAFFVGFTQQDGAELVIRGTRDRFTS